jgi:hypothetical protein
MRSAGSRIVLSCRSVVSWFKDGTVMWDQLSVDSRIVLSFYISCQLCQESYYHVRSVVSWCNGSVISRFKDRTIMWDQLSADLRIVLSYEISCQLIQESQCHVRTVVSLLKNHTIMWDQLSAVSRIVLSCEISCQPIHESYFQLLAISGPYNHSRSGLRIVYHVNSHVSCLSDNSFMWDQLSAASLIILTCESNCQLLQESLIMWDLLPAVSRFVTQFCIMWISWQLFQKSSRKTSGWLCQGLFYYVKQISAVLTITLTCEVSVGCVKDHIMWAQLSAAFFKDRPVMWVRCLRMTLSSVSCSRDRLLSSK